MIISHTVEVTQAQQMNRDGGRVGAHRTRRALNTPKQSETIFYCLWFGLILSGVVRYSTVRSDLVIRFAYPAGPNRTDSEKRFGSVVPEGCITPTVGTFTM